MGGVQDKTKGWGWGVQNNEKYGSHLPDQSRANP